MLISFLSDFGHKDTYVGQVKGVIARVAPGVRVVDLTHDVPAHDVRTGAFLLMSSVEVFPDGTVHLAVVDPGVGSSRRPVAVKTARGDTLVGPENGLLNAAAERLGGVREAVELSDEGVGGSPRRSSTFHGRDLFGPAAARLASGAPLSSLGTVIDQLSAPFALPTPETDGPFLRGEVLHVDTYGNLVTNIPAQMLPERFTVHVGDAQIGGAPHSHYGAVGSGELLALVGSAASLEISARDASASLKTHARRGDTVVVETQST